MGNILKKTKLIPLAILLAIFFGTIGSAFAYQEYLYRWSDDGGGDTHGGCHGDEGTAESIIGTLELSINETGNLTPLQPFTLDVIIKNFTEALVDPYTYTSSRTNVTSGRVTLGVPGYLGDNAEFTSGLSHQTLNRGEILDDWGSYDDNTDNEFMLFAPNKAGVFVLWAVAIAGMNQSDASAANLTYIEGSITVTVVAPNGGGDGGTIAGDILLITVGSAFIVTIVMVVKKKHKISEDKA